MRINADFAQPARVDAVQATWQRSPASGVERLMLDRVGDEVARATSLVRFAPNSQFDAHRHDAGEEYFVIDGVFSDESGDYPAGRYVRNPPGTAHTPQIAAAGCLIWVKLRQFAEDDLTPVVIDTDAASGWHTDPNSGIARRDLHAYRSERVGMVRLPRGAVLPLDAQHGGAELLLLDGRLTVEGETLDALAWWRFPPGHRPEIAATDACRMLLKTGHLHGMALAA